MGPGVAGAFLAVFLQSEATHCDRLSKVEAL
jgi:hypothetical protein